MTLQQQKHNSSVAVEIENGLDFIINHFDPTILYFPRTIMTKKLNRQVEVYSKQEALRYFQQSNYIDCRINAFRYSSSNSAEKWNPDLIFIDIDKNDFKTDTSFKLALSRTLKNIKEKLNGFPTINWSGNGYHILQPVECPIILEEIEQFQKYKNNFFLSQEFLRFEEYNLSDGKADLDHHPSFKSCHIRIPNSFNGKCLDNRDIRLSGNLRVKILNKWNGIRPLITKEFLEDFRTYLEQKITDLDNNSNNNYKNYNYNNNINNNYAHHYQWIEKLLQTPIEDYRKLVLWKILCPYLVNTQKLPLIDSFQILKHWLNKCNSIRKLDFNPNQKIKDNLNHVGIFYPLGIQKLKTDEKYSKLYQFLKEKIELNTSKNREVKN